MKDIQLDEIEAISFEDKFIITLPKRITELVGKKIKGHLAIQNNRIIWLGPRVIEPTDSKTTSRNMETANVK